MREKCKQTIENSQAFGTLLTDLSKAFDCLPDKFLVAKSNAHEFSLKALKLSNSYRPRRIKEQKSTNLYNSLKEDSLWSASRLGTRTYFAQHISQ